MVNTLPLFLILFTMQRGFWTVLSMEDCFTQASWVITIGAASLDMAASSRRQPGISHRATGNFWIKERCIAIALTR